MENGYAKLGLLLLYVGLWLASIRWAALDAEKRGRSGCVAALLVFIMTWPFGLIAWLLFRPPKLRP
jgi:hypothetical protein